MFRHFILFIFLSLSLIACSGGSTSSTENNQDQGADTSQENPQDNAADSNEAGDSDASGDADNTGSNDDNVNQDNSGNDKQDNNQDNQNDNNDNDDDNSAAVTNPALIAPTQANIEKPITDASPYGLLKNFSAILPACTIAEGAVNFDVTYALTNLPTGFAYDAASRKLSISDANHVSKQVVSATVTYTCTDNANASNQASRTFSLSNDKDSGGAVDQCEYDYGFVPVLNNAGWFDFNDTNSSLYPTNLFVNLFSGITSGLDESNNADDSLDPDNDGVSTADECVNGSHPFVANKNGQFQKIGSNSYATMDQPFSVMIVDLDNNNYPDLVTSSATAERVRVYYNDGDGTFDDSYQSARDEYTVNRSPRALAFADVNNDNYQDILVSRASEKVMVMVNQQDKTFSKTDYTLNGSLRGITAGDFNADDYDDFAVIDTTSNQVKVLLNDGDGTFDDTLNAYNMGNNPNGIASGDVDADGHVDIILTSRGDDKIIVMFNDGDGTFDDASASYTVGDFPEAVAVADVNGDSKLDIVCVNRNDDTLTVLLNDGDRNLDENGDDTKTTYNTDDWPVSVRLNDVNNDGKKDITIVSSRDNKVRVFINDGDGTFDDTVRAYNAGNDPRLVYLGDVDQDNDADLAVVNNDDDTVLVMPNDGKGQFDKAVMTKKYDTADTPYGIAVFDLNEDSKLDFIVANIIDANLKIYLNDGDGTFDDNISTFATSASAPVSLASGDLNKDGHMDLVVTDVNDNEAVVHLHDADKVGTLKDAVDYAVGSTPADVVLADVNKDSYLDIITANQSDHTFSVLLADANNAGTFLASASYAVGDSTKPSYLTAADVNNDGHLDLMTSNSQSNTMTVFLNDGDGTFDATKTSYATGAQPYDIVSGDFNRDGHADVVVSNTNDDTLKVFLNDGDGTFDDGTATYATGDAPYGLFLGDVNSDGFVDIGVTNGNDKTVKILINDGDGTFDNNSVSYQVSNFAQKAALADLNNDFKLDLIVTNRSDNSVMVFGAD